MPVQFAKQVHYVSVKHGTSLSADSVMQNPKTLAVGLSLRSGTKLSMNEMHPEKHHSLIAHNSCTSHIEVKYNFSLGWGRFVAFYMPFLYESQSASE